MIGELRWVGWLVAWAGAAYGALLLESVPGDFGHGWCGPWGCFPPLQALAAMHLFWTVLLVPPTAWAIRRCPLPTLRRLGITVTLLGALSVTLLAVRETLTWLPKVPAEYRRYLARRILYALATWTDYPAVQLTLAGVACWVAAARPGKRPQGKTGSDETGHDVVGRGLD
jgi:hypothetical protein